MDTEIYARKYRMLSPMSCSMYQLGCHCFVALYMITDCFNVEVTARIKSVAPRMNHGSTVNTILLHAGLQNKKSITWAIVTGKKGGKG